MRRGVFKDDGSEAYDGGVVDGTSAVDGGEPALPVGRDRCRRGARRARRHGPRGDATLDRRRRPGVGRCREGGRRDRRSACTRDGRVGLRPVGLRACGARAVCRCRARSRPGPPLRRCPTFGLALGSLPDAHWGAAAPGSPLRRWRLIEVGAGPLASSPLRISERCLFELVGTPQLDHDLDAVLEPVRSGGALTDRQSATVASVVAAWSAPRDGARPPTIAVHGGTRSDRRAIIAAAAAEAGLELYALATSALPGDAAALEALSRSWEREAALRPAVLLVDVDEAHDGARVAPRPLRRPHLRPTRGERRTSSAIADLGVEVAPPSAPERRLLWEAALTSDPPRSLDADALDELASQFRAGRRRHRRRRPEGRRPASRCTRFRRCRALGRVPGPGPCGIEALAERIGPVATWSGPRPSRTGAATAPRSWRTSGTGSGSRRWGFGGAATGASASTRCSPGQWHGKDHGRRGRGRRTPPGPLPRRSQRGREQVHRRDGEEPGSRVRRRRGGRRRPALRRSGRTLRQAHRGARQPRSLRQHRGQLPPAAHGVLPRPRHPHHQHAELARPGVLAAAPVRRGISVPRRDRASRALAAILSGGHADGGPRLPSFGPACRSPGGSISNMALASAFLAAPRTRRCGWPTCIRRRWTNARSKARRSSRASWRGGWSNATATRRPN